MINRMDGYGSKFYKAAWDIVGPKVVETIQSFFVNGKLLENLNAGHLNHFNP